jgi:hypothetical protein
MRFVMKIDMHFHVLGDGIDITNVDNDVYFCADDNNRWFTRMLYNLVEGDLKKMEADLNRDGKISNTLNLGVSKSVVTS